MRIFIVEDDRRMAELLRQGLSEEGHSAMVASNGRDAFDIAKHELFDLLILDVMLPGMDGFTIAKRLRELNNRTPILMLTARDATQDVVHGLDLGADDYLTKPFSFDVLFARVRAVARRGRPRVRIFGFRLCRGQARSRGAPPLHNPQRRSLRPDPA